MEAQVEVQPVSGTYGYPLVSAQIMPAHRFVPAECPREGQHRCNCSNGDTATLIFSSALLYLARASSARGYRTQEYPPGISLSVSAL